MTSKISYFKFIREHIRQRNWLLALSSIGCFLALPLFTMFRLDSIRENNYYTPDIEHLIIGTFNGSNNALMFFILLILPVVTAVTGFAYMHSKEKLDFYHSLPLKRGNLFVISYLSGLILFLLPYLIFSGINLGVICAYGYGSGGLVKGCLGNMLLAVIAFLLVYHIVILGMVLTGQHVTALLGAGVISCYPILVYSLYMSLQSTFYKSWHSSSMHDTLSTVCTRLSAAPLFIGLTLRGPDDPVFDMNLVCTVLLCTAFLAAAAVLYRFYRSESAENALSFPKTAPFIKVLVCVPVSLFIGEFFVIFTGTDTGMKWIVIGSLLSSIILCGVIEFIYKKDVRLLFQSWISTLVSIAAVAGILCFFYFDLSGYDRYLPDRDELEGISFLPNVTDNYLYYPGELEQDHFGSGRLGFYVPESAVDEIYALAQEGIENFRNGTLTDADTDCVDTTEMKTSIEEIDDEHTYLSTVFRYKLKNGRVVLRQYGLSRSSLAKAFDTVCKEESFRRDLFPIFHVSHQAVQEIELLSLITGMETKLDLTKEQIEELLSAYETDLLQTEIRVLIEETPLTSMNLIIPEKMLDAATLPEKTEVAAITQFAYTEDSSLYDYGSDYEVLANKIYPGFDNTISCLEKYGYSVDPDPFTEDSGITVRQVNLYFSEDIIYSGAYDELLSRLGKTAEAVDASDYFLTLSDPEDIHIVEEYVVPNITGLLGSNHNVYCGWAEFVFTSPAGDDVYYSLELVPTRQKHAEATHENN